MKPAWMEVLDEVMPSRRPIVDKKAITATEIATMIGSVVGAGSGGFTRGFLVELLMRPDVGDPIIGSFGKQTKSSRAKYASVAHSAIAKAEHRGLIREEDGVMVAGRKRRAA